MVCSLLGAKREADTMLSELNLSVNLLDINKYSRPGTKLAKVKGVVVHYTANPRTDAIANRNYFNNLPKINAKKGTNTYASSHFVIGIDGTIVQCIPTGEIAYASNDRNLDTISIECCHKKKNGKLTKATYHSLIRLTKYLCIRFGLEVKDVIRHYDVTGKNCPKYFVQHPDAWTRFLEETEAELVQ
ncbi:MAG: N-acetylmuramoyl-L-alanine amidase [Eubacterium sp.]|nr:N-acetylmuramoyl-L-alanine amidase [Eubacterium sp.]